MTKRLLLSGFPGWLGDNIVDWFYTHKDHDYTHLRCLVAPWITKNQIDEYTLKYPQLEIIFGNFTNRSDLEKACHNCDAIIHSAGIIHVNRVNQWYDVNTEGTKLFHAVAEKNNIDKFIFISSNAAGGRSIENELLTENHPNQPLSDYGHSKKRAEDYLLKNNQITKSVILRPCMFYGMPVPHRHVDIFKRIETGFMPVVCENNLRSMTHVKNLTESCFLALKHEEALNEVFYVADEKPYSIKEYIDVISQELKIKPRLLRLPKFAAQISYLIDRGLNKLNLYNQNFHLLGEADWSVGVSIDKAKKLLHYQPKYHLSQGIHESIQWYKSQKRIDE